MPKNILIFSDGTGQAGGINFDEARTNVYKLYRACRVGPDTLINPTVQVAFYDAGLGSSADGGHLKIGWMRTIYNVASMVTGLGITANIIDCYAAIIRLYEDGDRIFLIGFSRGAYTVRSLAGVMSYCGIPRHLPDGVPLRLDVDGSRKLAEHAVKNVYQFCSSYDRASVGAYRRFILNTRDAIAENFRSEHGSTVTKNGTEQANIFPYFIGVFDTVAALGNRLLAPLALLLAVAILVGLHFLGTTLQPRFPVIGRLMLDVTYLSVTGAILLFLKNYLKMAPSLSGYSFLKRLATTHFTQPKHKFYDTTLNVNVGYAKHAISIDENRADFARVGWSPTAEKAGKRDEHKNLYFEQVWFPGVHADVGGGYIENEARLSDVALSWMLAAASIIPDGLKHDQTVLKLWPDPSGPQHNEQAGTLLRSGLRDLPADRQTHRSEAQMHKSVYLRFKHGAVLLFDKIGQYRPQNMRTHVDFEQYYDPNNANPQPASNPECVADDIEMKWEKAGWPGKL